MELEEMFFDLRIALNKMSFPDLNRKSSIFILRISALDSRFRGNDG
jgi:hypothetical protein